MNVSEMETPRCEGGYLPRHTHLAQDYYSDYHLDSFFGSHH